MTRTSGDPAYQHWVTVSGQALDATACAGTGDARLLEVISAASAAMAELHDEVARLESEKAGLPAKLAPGLPARVTLRLVRFGGTMLLIEHDGTQVSSTDLEAMDDEAHALAGAEAAYRTLGYHPDHWRMWHEDTLILDMYRDRPVVRYCIACGKPDGESHPAGCDGAMIESVILDEPARKGS